MASGCISNAGANYGLTPYFPKTEFTDLKRYESDIPTQFANLLTVANEPVIFNDPSLKFAMRLTIHAAYTGTAVIRMEEKGDGTIVAEFKKFGPRSVNGTLPLMTRGPITLTAKDVSLLRQSVEQQDFWAVDNRQDVVGSDGSDWLLEVKDGVRYHVVYRWWPSSGPVFEIGTELMRLTDFQFVDR